MESEGSTLQQQLTNFRTCVLMTKEQEHVNYRESWQVETAKFAELRSARDALSRQKSDLARQVAARWGSWRPLWSARLTWWNERAVALSEATVQGRQFTDAVEAAWDLLKEEQEARADVARAIDNVQTTLATLAHQVA